MRPEWSIIILTVFAGIAEGIVILLVGGNFVEPLSGGTLLPKDLVIYSTLLALAMTLFGLIASFFHLHHKSRGIKAIMKIKTSWLSREVILLPLFIAALFFYLLFAYLEVPAYLLSLISVFALISGLFLGISSAMIYFSIKFIKEWGNFYTVFNFLAIGLVGGGIALISIFEFTKIQSEQLSNLMIAFMLIALISFAGKLASYRYNDNIYSPIDTNRSLGMVGEILITDTGAAYPTYNTIEYNYKIAKGKIFFLRTITVMLLFALPIIGILIKYYIIEYLGNSIPFATVLFPLVLVGSLIERWLFFVEGNHLQNVFYGNYEIKNSKNPILSAGSTR